MFRYKIDLIYALREKGVTSATVRTTGLVSQSTLTDISRGKMVSFKSLDRICRVLNMQLSEFIEWVPDDSQ